jgi:D-hydroxyproline dehydrogenase subunit gamma
MRWTAPGLHPRGEAATILVGGRPVECSVGDTVAAALVAAGELTCRLTRQGDPRGVFCGMGVCFDCLVVVDGVPNTRACMTWVREGMQVSRQDGLA